MIKILINNLFKLMFNTIVDIKLSNNEAKWINIEYCVVYFFHN